MFETDVLVCGAGPGGLAAAIAARQRGLAVTVADGAHGPNIDKACGEGLLPDALAAAQQLGIEFPSAPSYAFRGIRFLGKSVSATAQFRSGCGLGVRRTELHRTLANHAQRIGVKLLWGTPVTCLDQIDAKWIVGADGERSRVRGMAGLDVARPQRIRYGFRRHHRLAPWSDYVEVYWGAGLQIYVTPVARDQVCIAAVSKDPRIRVDHALEQFPDLRQRLSGTEIVSAERGAATTTRKLPSVTRGRIALVGDASGSVDAVTGAGVSLAFQQALALGDALAHGRLPEYERAHRRIMRGRRIMANVLLAMDRWPEIGERARQALSMGPWMFDRLLALHMR
jgi:flavin-dependent dehydrogenase